MAKKDEAQGPSRQVLLNAAVIIGFMTLLLFFWYALPVLLLIFLSILVAIPIHAFTAFTSKHTAISHRTAFFLVTSALFAFGVGGIYFFGTGIISQIGELSDQLPQALASVRESLSQTGFGRFLADAPELRGLGRPSSIISRATGVVSTTVSAVFMAAMVIFIGVYIAYEPTLYTNGLMHLVPLKHRKYAAEILGALGLTLRKWLFGQLMAMTVVGILTTIGLWLLDAPFALGLGFLAGLLDFVPNFGPILAAAPAVLMVLAEDPEKAIQVALLYFIIQQIEGMFIMPIVQRRAVRLPPALTIVSQVLLGILAGPLGLLLATPLAAVSVVLVKMLYVRDTLGDNIRTPAEKLREREKPPIPAANSA